MRNEVRCTLVNFSVVRLDGTIGIEGPWERHGVDIPRSTYILADDPGVVLRTATL